MNALDYVFLAVIAIFLVWGLFRGLVKEVVTTLGVPASYLVANSLYKGLAPEMRFWLSDPALMSIAAYAILLVGTFILIWLVSYILTRVFRIVPPAWLEFPGGAVFGAVKGVLICAVALVSLNAFLGDAAVVRESNLAPRLEPLSKFMERFAPGHMRSFDPSELGDMLAKQKEAFQAKLAGGGNGSTPDKSEKEEAEAKLPKEIKEMKDSILKGMQDAADK